MSDLDFTCFNCSKTSPFKFTSSSRDEVKRFTASREDRGTVKFICIHCEMTNEIELTLDAAIRLLDNLSSEDPLVREAIDRAKEGDLGLALDVARKKFGF